eukprot:COSAG02_NODE_10343_length_1963_cov_20.945684_1_plen_55_part_00
MLIRAIEGPEFATVEAHRHRAEMVAVTFVGYDDTWVAELPVTLAQKKGGDAYNV